MIVGSSKSPTIDTHQLAVPSKTAERPSKYVYSTEFLKDYASEMAIQYGLTPLQFTHMLSTIKCESDWQIYPKPNHISWGIAQFTPPTWKDFGHGDIMDPLVQLEIMAKMWKAGLQNRWDCYTGKR